MSMRGKKQSVGTAPELLADFQTALVTMATSQAAQYEAKRSESELLQHLSAVSSGGYLQPDTMSSDIQADVTRGSLDAHFKKVQAQQLDSLSNQRLADMQAFADVHYVGRRIVVTQPKGGLAIDAVWYDDRHGYRNSPYKRTTVSGTIEAIMLDRNVIVIKPSWELRLLNNRLHNYAVYPISPDSAEPVVSIALP